jgi:hypothetical protein
MNISRLVRSSIITMAGLAFPFSLPAATVVLFDNLTPTVIGGGSISWKGDSQSKVSVNTVSGFGLTPMTGGDPTVMSLPAFSNSEGLLFETGLVTGNGGGDYINQYTMVFDIYWDTTSPWSAFYNAEGINDNDADFFRRGSDGAIGIGIGGYYGTTENNQWYRVAFTVTNTDDSTTKISIYLNGVYLGESVRVGGTDGRFSLYLAGQNQTALFTDDTGETGAAYVSQFYFDDRIYSPEEIAALGGVSAYAIPEPMTMGLLIPGVAGMIGMIKNRRKTALPQNRSATVSAA